MIVFKLCTVDDYIPDYFCDECGKAEMGRVRGVVFFHKSLKEQLTEQNLTAITWWEKQLSAKTIIVIPSVRGTFDGGAPISVTGFGDQAEKITGKTFTVVINDVNHTQNYKFYEGLENNYFKNYYFGFITESELRVGTDVITGFSAVDAVAEDVTSNVLWVSTISWIQEKPHSIVPIYELNDEVRNIFINCIEEVIPSEVTENS